MDEMTKRLLRRKSPVLAATIFVLLAGWLINLAGML